MHLISLGMSFKWWLLATTIVHSPKALASISLSKATRMKIIEDNKNAKS